MVRIARMTGLVVGLAICLLLLVSGCQKDEAVPPPERTPPRVTMLPEPPEEPQPVENPQKPPAGAGKAEVEKSASEGSGAADLTLKFAPGQAATYKITTEAQKSVEWMNSSVARPAEFQDGRTGNHIEMTFEQRVQEAGDDGALVEITIKALQYVGESQSKVVLDFDGARDKDPSDPLAKLIGKSYRLRLSPRGEVLAVLDIEPLRRAVKGDAPGAGTAAKLLSEVEIRGRHELPPLSAAKETQVRAGQMWSNIKTLSFGMMGAKSFERVYTLKQAGQEDGLAIVEMKAIPSSALAEQIHKQQSEGLFSRMFDSMDSYEGRLALDLQRGQVREYVEQMQTEWVIPDPEAVAAGRRPAAIKMAARQLLRLERIP